MSVTPTGGETAFSPTAQTTIIDPTPAAGNPVQLLLEQLGGSGTLTGGGTNYVLNFGTAALNATSPFADLGILNSASGSADDLFAGFAISGGTAFANAGFSKTVLTFGSTYGEVLSSASGLPAGAADTAPQIVLNTGSAGTYSETIIVSPTDSNPSGYSAALAPVTLTVEGNVACFCPGTRILTPRGDIPVERLSIGDTVVTLDGTLRPIVWTGLRTIDCRRHPRPTTVWPFRVARGAFGPSTPSRDLYLSPDHAIFWRDVLVPVKLLANGATIQQMPRATVTYHHIELARHDLILAEGLPAETYLDTGNRTMFDVEGTPLVLYPDFATGQRGREIRSCAPFVDRPDQVEPVWRAIAARAEAMGWPVPGPPTTLDDPELGVILGARRLRPLVLERDRYTFVLPSDGVLPIDGATARLVSRAARPSDLRPWVSDDRLLGVKVRRLVFRNGHDVWDIGMDHSTMAQGWWAVEHDDRGPCRWTRGDAVLPLPCGRAGVLEVELAGTMQYLTETPLATMRETSRVAATRRRRAGR